MTDEKSDNQNLTNKIELKTHLDSIQKEIFLFLKPLGFKKKGRTFNRQTENGIYQVINIQSGRYEFGDKYVIPGFRENFYGKFTVNLGVMVKEIYELESHNKPKDIYHRDKICRNLGNLEDGSPRAKLDVALIELHRDKSKAEKLFQDYYNNIEIKNRHKSPLIAWAEAAACDMTEGI